MTLTSKLAALYAQNLPDPIIIDAVNDIENLTASFSRKIWQKITILDSYEVPAQPANGPSHAVNDQHGLQPADEKIETAAE